MLEKGMTHTSSYNFVIQTW